MTLDEIVNSPSTVKHLLRINGTQVLVAANKTNFFYGKVGKMKDSFTLNIEPITDKELQYYAMCMAIGLQKLIRDSKQ